jgi:hypothetical protein
MAVASTHCGGDSTFTTRPLRTGWLQARYHTGQTLVQDLVQEIDFTCILGQTHFDVKMGFRISCVCLQPPFAAWVSDELGWFSITLISNFEFRLSVQARYQHCAAAESHLHALQIVVSKSILPCSCQPSKLCHGRSSLGQLPVADAMQLQTYVLCQLPRLLALDTILWLGDRKQIAGTSSCALRFTLTGSRQMLGVTHRAHDCSAGCFLITVTDSVLRLATGLNLFARMAAERIRAVAMTGSRSAPWW